MITRDLTCNRFADVLALVLARLQSYSLLYRLYNLAQDFWGVTRPSVPTIATWEHEAVTWELWCVGVLADLAVLVLQKNDNKSIISGMATVVQVCLRDL